MRVGVWRPDDQHNIYEISVLSASDLEYLPLAIEESDKTPLTIVVVAPNWASYIEEIAFWIKTKHYPNAELIIRNVMLKNAILYWERKHDCFANLDFIDASIFDIIGQINGNRVTAFKECCRLVQAELCLGLTCGEGVGDNQKGDRFLFSMPSLAAFVKGVGELERLVARKLGGSEAAFPLHNFCQQLRSILLEISADPVGDRVVCAAMFEASANFWGNRSNYQLAFLHFYRAIDAILQATLIEEDLVEWDKFGSLRVWSESKRGAIQLTVGSAIRTLEESRIFVATAPVKQMIEQLNRKRNDSVLGHSVCGLGAGDVLDASAALRAVVKYLPDSARATWKKVSGKVDFDIVFPLCTPLELVEDLDSGISIRKY